MLIHEINQLINKWQQLSAYSHAVTDQELQFMVKSNFKMEKDMIIHCFHLPLNPFMVMWVLMRIPAVIG